jgi:hypothetical protein
VSCYRLFFTSTLLYESLSITLRLHLFEKLQEKGRDGSLLSLNGNVYLQGLLTGAFTQVVTAPLFRLNVAAHSFYLGDTERAADFRKKLGFKWRIPAALVGRGAMLGTV